MITVESNLKSFNRAIEKYAKEFDVDFTKLVRWCSVGLIKDVAQGTPVRTGRARAGWLPFLWSERVSEKLKSDTKKLSKSELRNLHKYLSEGVKSCSYKKRFSGQRPYAWIQNRVHYIVYLNYGVRRPAIGPIRPGEKFHPVSKQQKRFWINDAVNAWRKKLIDAIKHKDRANIK